jgi:SAM-dependent methyltransferase
MLGRLLARRYKDCALLSVSKLRKSRDSSFLDVGSGGGKLLRQMAAIGFQNLSGIDPFLPSEVKSGNGVRIWKCRLGDVPTEKFDVVMFHHSLEHVADPKSTLRIAARLLAPGGTCLIRLPVVTHAWERYGTNWAQLDPPRHMWLPTTKAIRLIAEASRLKVDSMEYDSTDFQFWGSELSARGVPLGDVNPRNLKKFFRKSEIASFREEAARLNREGLGDSAVCVLSAGAPQQNPKNV